MRKCSDWCGRGCTQEEYDLAVLNADKLVEQLGKGWVPRVHENMGWFFRAVSASGTIKVSVSVSHGNEEDFLAFIGEAGFPGGQFVGRGDTPKGAVAVVIQLAQVKRDELTKWMAGFE